MRLSRIAVAIALVYALGYFLVGLATPALNDPTISAVVRSNLVTDLETAADKIMIDTIDGVVTLSGTVPTVKEKFDAEGITRGTTGVTEVINKINIDPGPAHAIKTEEQIEKDAEEADSVTPATARL